MSRLNPIGPKQASKELQGVLNVSHITLEGVPDFLKVLANSGATLKAYVEAEEALENGQLTPRFREQIALAVAEINGCNYSLAAHSLAGREAGLTDEEVRLARKATALDLKAEAMLRFTQLIVLQRGKINDEDFHTVVKAGFSPAELVEIVANIVLNIFTNYLNLVAKTEADFRPPEADGQALGAATQQRRAEVERTAHDHKKTGGRMP